MLSLQCLLNSQVELSGERLDSKSGAHKRSQGQNVKFENHGL